MNKILIISPHFPPDNTPDMHRIRSFLPFFKDYKIKVEILAINPKFTEAPFDKYLLKSIPENIIIHRTKALNQRHTRKFGLGNLGIRAFFYFFKKGNKIISDFKPDLIFFSTTVFSILPLGRIWKKKFNVPYIIDMQDPWRNDYYLDLPKKQRPPKYWFAHRLNSILEKYTIPHVSGLISVNHGYIETLIKRYPKIKNVKTLVLPLGATKNDFQLINVLDVSCSVNFNTNFINAVYTGVVPDNMKFSIEAIIAATKEYNKTAPKKIKLFFIGTNYAPKERQQLQVIPLARKYDFENFVFELPDRVSYYEAIKMMLSSDFLLLPGTHDINYTASKLYPYILAKKKVLAVFNEKSELITTLKEVSNIPYITFNKTTALNNLSDKILNHLNFLISEYKIKVNSDLFEKYTDKAMIKLFIKFIRNDKKNI